MRLFCVVYISTLWRCLVSPPLVVNPLVKTAFYKIRKNLKKILKKVLTNKKVSAIMSLETLGKENSIMLTFKPTMYITASKDNHASEYGRDIT